jgi:TldD protein
VNLATNRPAPALYRDVNPIHEVAFSDKVTLLGEIDAYLRSKDTRVKQVSASVVGNYQHIAILRPGDEFIEARRPLVRVNISVAVEEHGRMETGSSGAGARTAYEHYIHPDNWKKQADEALRQALVNLEARPAPAGELPVVLGSGG